MGFEIVWKKSLEDGCDLYLNPPDVTYRYYAGSMDIEILDKKRILIDNIIIDEVFDTDENREELFKDVIEAIKLTSTEKIYVELENDAFRKPKDWYQKLGFEEDDSIDGFRIGTTYGDKYISVKI